MARDPENGDSTLQNQVEDAGKKAGKGVLRAIKHGLKKLAAKHPALIAILLKIILVIVLVILSLLIIMLIWLYVKQAFIDFKDAWNKDVLYVLDSVQGQFVDHKEYEKWRGDASKGLAPEDPDMTESTIAGIKEAMKCKQKYLDADYDNLSDKQQDQVDAYEQYKALVDNRHLYAAPKDILDVLERCRDDNMEMFRISGVNYGIHIWVKYVDPDTGAIKWKEFWDEAAAPIYYVSDIGKEVVDSYFGDETSSNIEGEKDTEERRRFAEHWQDVIGTCMFYSMNNKDEWDWDRAGGAENARKSSYEANTDDYYLTDEDIEKIADLFTYKTDYRYDAMDDGEKFYSYKDLEAGTAAFHLFKDDVEPPDAKDTFYTRFIPISAVEKTKNSWETLTYTYTRTEKLPIGVYKLPNDTFVYPEGEYCTGRFDVVDPAPFIWALEELVPTYYRNTPEGVTDPKKKEEAEKYVKQRNYKWAEEMMQSFTDNLGEMPAVEDDTVTYGADANPITLLATDEAGHYSRVALYTNLAKDFTDGIVRISYEGTQFENVEGKSFAEQLQELEDKITAEYATYGLPAPKFMYPSQTGGWTEDLGSAKMGISTFYPLTPDLSAFPFRSYGVIYCSGNQNGSGGSSSGNNINLTGSTTIWISPNSSGGTPVEHPGNHDDQEKYGDYGTATIYDGALANLYGVSDKLTLDQIKAMLQYIQDKFDRVGADPSIDFPGAAQAVYDWQNKTGQSVSAMLTFILAEGTYARDKDSQNHARMWNFFNRVAGAVSNTTKPVVRSANGKWIDMKKTYGGDFNSALIDNFNYIVDKYLAKGQNNFYQMCFQGYGMPTTKEEADAAGQISHSYCPWWGSAYKNTGKSEDLYPNRLASGRVELLEAAGKNIASYGVASTLENTANWFLKNVDFYDKPSTTSDDKKVSYGDDAPFKNLTYGGSNAVRADCSGFASAYVAALAPDQQVTVGSSASFAQTSSSVGKALQSIGWSLHPASDFKSVDDIPEGAIMVADGHVEVVSGVENGKISTFGWGKVQSSYPSSANRSVVFTPSGKILYGGKTYDYIWSY